MAEAFVDTAVGISDGQEKLEDVIEMITFKSNPITELSYQSKKPENVFGSSGKGNIRRLQIFPVGDFSGG